MSEKFEAEERIRIWNLIVPDLRRIAQEEHRPVIEVLDDDLVALFHGEGGTRYGEIREQYRRMLHMLPPRSQFKWRVPIEDGETFCTHCGQRMPER